MKIDRLLKLKKNVKHKEEHSKAIFYNDTDRKGFIVFARPIYIKEKHCKIESDVEVLNGSGCQIKILNKKMRVVENLEPKSLNYFDNINKLIFIGITVFPHSEIKINSLNLTFDYNKEKEISSYFEGDSLLICPGYPSEENKYNFAFIHTRMQAYQKFNLKVDLAVVNENFINRTSISYFEDVRVVMTGYNDIRKVLQNRIYKQILVHFFDEKYAQILDASNILNTSVILYSHGSDTLYRVWDKLNARYFEPLTTIPYEISSTFPIKDALIKRYNEKENVQFVFVSEWAKKLSENLIGIKYNHASVIPCNIDEDMFKYEKKDPELRKKIFVLRKYDNLSTYAIDIAVRVILELSTRDFFSDLEFSFYGDGEYHDVLLKPLRHFSNVHIYQKFLSHQEIAQVHKEHGIGLFATRFDTQAVSACEAALSGNVVITSKGVGTEEYIDPKLGTYCETENIKEYADLIEKIYKDKSLFSKLSKGMHESVAKTCGIQKTIQKDIALLSAEPDFKLQKYQKPVKKPILTIAVPSYNVEKFLINGIHSLIDNKYSNKLEILIINDGSKDNTAEIGKQLEELTTVDGKSIVKLVDKENGGHGSTINKGIELATGKYFKLMDGDDYFIYDDFIKFIDILEHEDSDIILTNYVADYAIDAKKIPVRHYEFMIPGVQYRLDLMDDFGYGFEEWGPLLSTSTYKTSILKEANFKIDEHCFYVDMEYNFIGYLHSNTAVYYPLDIYNYYLGRAGQSVSRESYRRNFKNHEIVTFRLIEEYYKISNISDNKRSYLKKRIVLPMVKAQYYVLTENLASGKEFRLFDQKLKKYQEIYHDPEIATRGMKAYRLLNGHALKFVTGLIILKKKILKRR